MSNEQKPNAVKLIPWDRAVDTFAPGRTSYIQQRMNNAPTPRILSMWYEIWRRVIRGKL